LADNLIFGRLNDLLHLDIVKIAGLGIDRQIFEVWNAQQNELDK